MAAPINPDLQKERDGASFDPLKLTYFLDNGKHFTERRRHLGRSSFFLVQSAGVNCQVDHF